MTQPFDLQTFVASMPERYLRLFELEVIEQHAGTAWTRGASLVSLEPFTDPSRPGDALCVVAPDRPGLLAMISLAFARCELDIVAAEVFTRHVGGLCDEAVDLFWVRHHPPRLPTGLSAMDLRGLRDCLNALLMQTPSELLPELRFGSRTPAATATVVRFLEDEAGRFVTLELETSDRTGLLLGVCQALFNEGIQIIGSHIKAEAGRVQGRFQIEDFSSHPIEQERRRDIKLAILSAVDQLSKDTLALVSARAVGT